MRSDLFISLATNPTPFGIGVAQLMDKQADQAEFDNTD